MEVDRVVTNPLDVARYRDEFYRLSRSITGATRSGAAAPLTTIGNFEQLVELVKGGEPDAMQRQVVTALKWLGRKSLEESKLTTPPEDNAHYYFSRLLELDLPEHAAQRRLRELRRRTGGRESWKGCRGWTPRRR